MYDLTQFTLSEMTRLGVSLRTAGSAATSMEDVSSRVVRTLYESLRMPPANAPACALVRLFVTLPYATLPGAQQEFARRLRPDIGQHQSMKCLTLLATAGERPEWNSRHQSAGHQALPLASAEAINRSPMINQLMRQLGVEVGTLVSDSAGMLLDSSQHTFNVFHVAEAPGSPFIPAQEEFVLPFGVQSVVGFGGLLPPGELFATILFSKAPVPRETAELFKTLALNVKVALLPFAETKVFT